MVDSSREGFEKWARQLVADKPFDLTPCANASCGPKFHHYESDATNGAWSAWQSSRSAAIEECAVYADDHLIYGTADALRALKGER